MSRGELTRALGRVNLKVVNAILSEFAVTLIALLNDGLPSMQTWHPLDAVVQIVPEATVGRATRPDDFAFVMRTKLAKALAANGIAPYVELSPRLQHFLPDDVDRVDEYPPDLL
jgi:hypothetical protein